MSDPAAPDTDPPAPDSGPSATDPPVTGPVTDLEISLAAFLPDDVELVGSDPPVAHADQDADGGSPTQLVEPAPPARPEPEVDLVLLDTIERDLGSVDAALVAIDDGTYGRCAVCATPIDADVLAADPVRRTCPEHI